MGKETREMLKTIISNQEIIMKHLNIVKEKPLPVKKSVADKAKIGSPAKRQMPVVKKNKNS